MTGSPLGGFRRFLAGGTLMLATLLGILPPGDVGAQEERALGLMNEASARYSEVQAFCASFHQSVSIPLLDQITPSRGSLCQRKPNFFAMRFTEPDGDLIVADGEWFWVFYHSSDPRQVLQFDMGARPGGVDFHREFLDSPGEKYDLSYVGEDSVGGTVTHVVALDPREPVGFEEARIWLDTDRSLILQVRLAMENGSVRTLTLSDIRLDPPPDPQRFVFTPPEGARVIRRH